MAKVKVTKLSIMMMIIVVMMMMMTTRPSIAHGTGRDHRGTWVLTAWNRN